MRRLRCIDFPREVDIDSLPCCRENDRPFPSTNHRSTHFTGDENSRLRRKLAMKSWCNLMESERTNYAFLAKVFVVPEQGNAIGFKSRKLSPWTLGLRNRWIDRNRDVGGGSRHLLTPTDNWTFSRNSHRLGDSFKAMGSSRKYCKVRDEITHAHAKSILFFCDGSDGENINEFGNREFVYNEKAAKHSGTLSYVPMFRPTRADSGFRSIYRGVFLIWHSRRVSMHGRGEQRPRSFP